MLNPTSKANEKMNMSSQLTEIEQTENGKPTTLLLVDGMAALSLARLRDRIGLYPPGPSVEWFSRIEAFSTRIRRLPSDIGIAVLFIPNGGRLVEIAALMEFLDSVRLILILPEESAALRRAALHLHPSYVCSPDSDFNDLTAVLDKIRVQPSPSGRRRE